MVSVPDSAARAGPRWRVPRLFLRPQRGWTRDNRVDLLENGEAYYPAVFEAIAQAQHEVLVETFILFEDKVGLELQRVLIEAAQRGVRVDLSVDGWGSPEFSRTFVDALDRAGVRLRAFDPHPRFLGLRLHAFRRMHRKIVVVDGRTAFVGGINFSADHLGDFGPEAKQDYAVRLCGPLVAQIRRFALEQIGEDGRPAPPDADTPYAAGTCEAMFVTRDNHLQRDAIERQYRAAIRAARSEVVIANAYFFPGYRLLKALRRAAQRGVKVRLILQGQPDMAIVKHAAELLHARLVDDGVEIYEYCKRPLHGKVAVVDGVWATVGSSNLDPLSLALNLEANVVIRDSDFARTLRANLDTLMCKHCTRLEPEAVARQRAGWRVLIDTVAYHFTRHFPAWAGWLPAHAPRVQSLAAPVTAAAPPTTAAANDDDGAVEHATESAR
jgi:cardiolipin synthase A/B